MRMTRNLLPLIGLLFLLTQISCKKNGGNSGPKPKPLANFSFILSGDSAPVTVSLQNLSTNAETYEWWFGDGSYSNEFEPGHVYKHGGTFRIILIAKGKGGADSISKSFYIGHQFSKVRVTGINLYAMPATKSNGSPWDDSSHPDQYFQIVDTLGFIVFHGATINAGGNDPNNKGDDPANTETYWLFNYNVPSFGSKLRLRWFDYDDDPEEDDYIGEAEFVFTGLRTGSNPYPERIAVTWAGVTTRLTLVWYN